MRAVLRHVRVPAEGVQALLLGHLHRCRRIRVLAQDIRTLGDERLGRLPLLARVVPGIDPHDLGMYLRIHAPGAQREGIDVADDFRNRKRADVSERIGLGHAAREHAEQVGALVETRLVGDHVRTGLVAGRMLEADFREQPRDFQRRFHVAERGRENDGVALGRELADHALGVRALRYALHVGGLDLRPEGLLERERPEVMLVRPAAVRNRADVDEGDAERRAAAMQTAVRPSSSAKAGHGGIDAA